MVDPIREQWEANSQAFAELIGGEGTPHHRSILNPCIEGLLGDVQGKKLLDAGCGEGYLSRFYATKGAYVTGVDISPKLIETCRSLHDQENLEIDFSPGSICDLSEFSDCSFDVVLCNLVLLNTPCLDEAMKEFHRVLSPGGMLVFSIVHPAYDFYGPGSWEMGEKDPTTNRRKGLFFKVDHYFDEKEYQKYWKTRDGEKFPHPISFFHRTLATYLNSVSNTGLVVTRIEEPKPSGDDDFFDRENRIPFFLVVKAEKAL